MEQESDPRLVELAQAGDQQAFAELYNRYFDPVYDFVARMTRNRDEAADIAQDTFLKAMNSLGGLQKGASFKGWIFTIARNTALNRLERAKRTRPLAFEDDEGEEVSFDVVDTDRFGSPEEAAEASAVAALVWQAAAGLDPKQLSLLDLHLRQGLDSGEIADVLGVTKNNGYVMLNRLKKAVEDSIGAFIMFKDGRRYCDDLDSALGQIAPSEMSPEIRKLVDRHVAQCEVCEERKKKLVAPLAVFGAFALVGSPTGAKAQILEHLMHQWPGPAAAGAGGAGGGGSAGAAAGPGGFGPFGAAGSVVKMFAGLGLAAAFLLAFLFVPASPIALTRSGGHTEVEAAVGDSSPTARTPTDTPTPATGASFISPTAGPKPTASPTPAPGSSTTPTPTPAAGATVPPPPPPPTSGPGTPTSTPANTPTKAPPPTATPTSTPTPSPTATPKPCTPSLSTNSSTINASGGSNSFVVLNNGCAAVDFTVFAPKQAPWLSVNPTSGSLTPFGSATIGVTADLESLSEGTHSANVLVSWEGGSGVVVTVTVTRQGNAPVVSSNNFCRVITSTNAGGYVIVASVTDDYAINTVTVFYTRPDNSTGSAPMTSLTQGNPAQGTFQAQISGAVASYTVTATDFAGHSDSKSGTCG